MPDHDLFGDPSAPHPAAGRPAPHALPASAAADRATVLRMLALAWTPRHRSWLIAALRNVGARTVRGTTFTQDEVDACLRGLAVEGVVKRGDDGWRCVDEHRVRLYREALRGPNREAWRDALLEADRVRRIGNRFYVSTPAQSATVARLLVYGGESLDRWTAFEETRDGVLDWHNVFDGLLLSGFDPVLFEDADPALAARLLSTALSWGLRALEPAASGAFRFARTRAASDRGSHAAALRCSVAETLLFRGEPDAADALLAELAGPGPAGLRAAVLATRGRWDEAAAGFETALAELRKRTGARKDLLPSQLGWLYPMCLFASRDAQRIARARRFCATESGTRDPQLYQPWGPWVHAADMRLGDRPREPGFLRPHERAGVRPTLETVQRRMLQAWSAAGHGAVGDAGDCTGLLERLRACELHWLAAQVEAADDVLAGRAPRVPFFASAGQDAWRDALAAIAALGHGEAAAQADAGKAEQTELLWTLEVDRVGRLRRIEPVERKRGARGWSRPKPVPLSRLAKAASLDPWDARVAHTIREAGRYGPKVLTLDLNDSAAALTGHPRVVFASALEQRVTLVEGSPEVRLAADGDAWRLQFVPDIAAALRVPDDDEDSDENERLIERHFRRDAPPRAPVFVERTGEATARLIRVTAAHRRVVELAEAGLRVPRAALAELQAVLPVLAAHFRLKAESTQGAEQVSASARLRAELAPAGAGVRLRLVAAPLGVAGPRLPPGAGREDVFAPIGGRLHACTRDLAAERDALAAVLGQFDFLDPPAGAEDAGDLPEWTVSDPREALVLVERLPSIAQVESVDWPSGRTVQVIAAGSDMLHVSVREDRQWFAIDGRLHLDETQVLELGELIEAVTRHRSRYVPIGEGRWLALSERLRQQVEDLAAVAERTRGATLRAPAPAAAWLDAALEDASVASDGALARRLSVLQAAIDAPASVPATLQANLRPYQEDGYAWLMQRARAGFGACLADDMGLGKTLQALAVLLERAELGPALVVAPTSVCANWSAEAQRFAPALRVRACGAGVDLSEAGAYDLVVVSYTMLQQAADRFSARRWATLVADEAQSIKNASAKRTQAVLGLAADFRVALSGTPIENRLGELWSIMGFANPGLLGSAERFAARFVRPIERDRDLRAQRALRRLIAPFVLRRTKAQVLDDLPPRTEITLAIEPSPREAAHYEALRREALAAAVAATAQAGPTQGHIHVLAQLTRLRRAACDPRLVNPELGLAGAKLEAFADLAAEIVANGHKALVFSQFTDFLALLRESAEAAGLRYQYLDGSTPAAERARRIAAFQGGDGDLFLISLKAGGFGLNLTAADYVIIVDPWWNPAAEDQASGRAHRIGQTRPVTVYRLVAQGTIEERIARLHQHKRALADGILDGIDASAAPDAAELIELMRGEGTPQPAGEER